MGCCGDREKAITVTEQQKWDYITLSDFKSTNCLAPFSYMWLWILAIISVAVYVADAFTAVNLIAFDKWSSEIQPAIPFKVAKWIFAVCIILSYVLIAIDWIRALRVIRSGGVAESYLDPFAVIFQSMRLGKGQGWRRFLVFAELTKSRKGVDYVALFVYFQFKGALLIILAEGPRVVVNGITLYAVMQANLLPVGDNAGDGHHSSFEQFFINVESLAQKNRQETIVYFTMLFSMVIWVIGALSLLISVILYVFFLWHYIPSADGRLSNYCRRKIDGRLDRIVSKKVKKALEKQDQKRRKEEQRGLKKPDGGNTQRMPTLPKLGGKDDDAASISSFQTSTTAPTLPPYSSQPPTRTNTMNTMGSTLTGASRQPTLPSFPADVRPLPPSRSETQSSAFSNASYSSNAPLLSQAGSMGYSEPGRGSPVPPMPALDRNADYMNNGPMSRTLTGNSQPPSRPYSPMSQRGPNNGYPPRVNTAFSSDGRASPSPSYATQDPRQAPPPRSNTAFSSTRGRTPGPSPLSDPTFSPYDNRAQPTQGPIYEMSPVDMSPIAAQNQSQNQGYGDIIDDYDPYHSPSPPNRAPTSPPRNLTPAASNQAQYAPYNAVNLRSGSVPPQGNGRPGVPAALQTAIQRREASNPLPNRGPGSVPPQRSATAPIQPPALGAGPTARSATAGPRPPQGYWNGQPQGGEQRW